MSTYHKIGSEDSFKKASHSEKTNNYAKATKEKREREKRDTGKSQKVEKEEKGLERTNH